MADNNLSTITQKVWSMCGVLYDDGGGCKIVCVNSR